MDMTKLQPAVARKYELATHHTIVVLKGREIHLCSLTLKEADKLVAAGNFPYLKKKEPAKKTRSSK